MVIEKQTESELKQTKIMYEAKLMAGESLSEDRAVKHDRTPFGLNTRQFSS